MKKLISWIILLIFVIIFSFFWNQYNWAKYISQFLEKDSNLHQTQYINEFKDTLRKDYPDEWIEIQDFKIGYNTISFAHVFYGRTFVCTDGKLFAKYKWEIQEIYSHDNRVDEITPCTFNVEQTKNKEVFLIDFCLSPGWWSWECLWQEMYYNFFEKTWKKWKLFYPEYPDGTFKKFEIPPDNINNQIFNNHSKIFFQDLWIFE